MKQELKIEIEVPEWHKAVYNEDTQRVEIVKVELPKTWEEFCDNYPVEPKESFIYEGKVNRVFVGGKRDPKNTGIFPNKETAEAFLALMQLIQLRDCYRQGWKPDWKDGKNKFSIEIIDGEITTYWDNRRSRILSFQSIEVRDEFLKNFRDLIEEAKELI